MISLFFTKSAQKQLLKLEKNVQLRIADALDILLTEPQPQNLDIKKLRSPLNGHRLRIGDYRILYVKESNEITIYHIAHRRDAY